VDASLTYEVMAEDTVDHGAAVAAAIGNARLAVLPGTHALPLELPDVVRALSRPPRGRWA
jgi:hypothetical protein